MVQRDKNNSSLSPVDSTVERPMRLIASEQQPAPKSLFVDQLTLWVQELEAEIERIRSL